MITDLGTLGGKQSSSIDINERGQIVGWSVTRIKDRFGDPTRHAFLWENGRMLDLGDLGGGFSQAFAINNRGQVVGRSDLANLEMHAFLWDKGKMIDLAPLGGESAAYAINDRGEVVGRYRGARGFLWRSGKLRDLGEPPHGRGIGSWADLAINESSQVVGDEEYGGTPDDANTGAFLWQKGRMTDLGSFGGRHTRPSDINDLGQVIGYSDTRALHGGDAWPLAHGFLWQNGRMLDLGTLGGEESLTADINEHGQVVGQAQTRGGRWHAFMWHKGKKTDLGVLPGSRYSAAVAVNDRGQVIGYSYPRVSEDGPSHAFLWQKGTMIDLGGLGGKFRYNQPVAINERGQIVGTSALSRTTYWAWDAWAHGRAVLWTLKRG